MKNNKNYNNNNTINNNNNKNNNYKNNNNRSNVHYPKISFIVKKFCEEKGIPYLHHNTLYEVIIIKF